MRPFTEVVSVFISDNLSPQAQSKMLAGVARNAIAESGVKDYRKYVDGHEGVEEERVRPAPNGIISYRFNLTGEVVKFALEYLISRSPPRSSAPVDAKRGKPTHFRDGFYVGVDGKFILASNFNPDMVPSTAEVVIGNRVAYARKIIVGRVGNKSLTFNQYTPGIFDDALREIKRKYGVSFSAKTVYTMTFPEQYRLQQEQSYTSGVRAGRARGRKGTLVESPAIIINPTR